MKKLLDPIRLIKSVIGRSLRDKVPRKFLSSYQQFLKDGGNLLLSEGLDLGERSEVVDIGGYLGDWSSVIHETYGCNVCIVEPIPEFVSSIRERFDSQKQIRVFPYVISSESGTSFLYFSDDGTGLFADGKPIQVETRQVSDFIDVIGNGVIDCLMMNIEGGEYGLLALLIEHGVIARTRHLLVQFHQVANVSQAEYEALQLKLRNSHRLIFDYPFVWQRWDLSLSVAPIR